MKKIKPFIYLLLPTILSACTSAPPELDATRPLIETVITTNSNITIPPELWQDLHKGKLGHVVYFNHVKVVLGRRYYSALGNVCRNVVLTQGSTQYTNKIESQKRAACYNEGTNQWQLMPLMVAIKQHPINFTM